MAGITTAPTSNDEKYIQESLACVDYLLRNTDDINYCNASEIVTYITEKYGYEPRRQRISRILELLEKHGNETRRLGFVISSKQTGKDPSRKKFFVSERLLTMMEINAIHIALLNYTTPLTDSSRIEKIIEGLKNIFPTDTDKKTYDINKDVLINVTGRTAKDKVKEIINQSFVKKFRIRYHLKDDFRDLYGRVKQIYYQGNGKYDIDIFDDEENKTRTIKLSDITLIQPLYTERIEFDFPSQVVGNLDIGGPLEKQNGFPIKSFLTIEQVNQYIKKPEDYDDYQDISFDFMSLDIIKSFKKEFGYSLIECLISKEDLDLCEEKRHELNTCRHTYARVYVSRKQFIKWASRPENILDLDNIDPFDVDEEIKHRLYEVNALATSKFYYSKSPAFSGFEIGINSNKTVDIRKVITDAKEIIIPDTILNMPVRSIVPNASINNQNIEKLVLGKNIREIGSAAFRNCPNLKEIVFNDSLKKIGDYAFENCSSLEYIRIDSFIQEIGKYAFANCDNLKEVGIFSYEPVLVNIYDHAFANCKSLVLCDLAFLKYLSKQVFENCNNLSSLFLRCSPNIYVESDYLVKPIDHVEIVYNKYEPEHDPFSKCINSNNYFYGDPVDWYNED